uniref:CTP synthase n=1 Tax=Lygus hesperus TaxID=30085 RepID=A0A0A9WCI1_LYGHE
MEPQCEWVVQYFEKKAYFSSIIEGKTGIIKGESNVRQLPVYYHKIDGKTVRVRSIMECSSIGDVRAAVKAMQKPYTRVDTAKLLKELEKHRKQFCDIIAACTGVLSSVVETEGYNNLCKILSNP